MATKRNKAAAAILAALIAAATALGLVKQAPKVPVPSGTESRYSVTSPGTRGFGSPCQTGDFVDVKVYGRTVVFNKGAVLPLKAAVALAMARSDYRPDQGVSVYACRTVRGSSTVWSHHAWATAVDFDPAQNCLGCSLSSTEIAGELEFIRAFTRFGFYWGGNFSRPDAMHFEYDGPYIPLRDVVRPGDSGPKVEALEALLAQVGLPRKADGKYEQKDILSVIGFQKKNSLFVIEKAGTVGPATWVLLVQVAAR